MEVPTTTGVWVGLGSGAGVAVAHGCEGGIVFVTTTRDGVGRGCEPCCPKAVNEDIPRASRQRVKRLIIILLVEKGRLRTSGKGQADIRFAHA